MTEQLVYLLLGLFFAISNIPFSPINNQTLVRFVIGVILVIMAFLNVHLIR